MKKIITLLFLIPLFQNSALASPPLTELNNTNFDQNIANSPLAIVDFNSKHCGASNRYREVLLDFAAINPSIDIYSVDVDLERTLTRDFNVQVYPTTYVFRYGRQIFGFSGVGSVSYLANKINSHP